MLINTLVFFILGTIVGSFLNVLVFRYNTGLSVIHGRSQCFSCGKKLFWYELVPLFSFIFLKGRCLECKSKISSQYFWVEFLTGLIFGGLYLKFGFNPILIFYLLAASILIAIAFYDFTHKIIPDAKVFSFDAVALIILALNYGIMNLLHGFGLLDFETGFILFGFFTLLWLVSLGKWMGFGDAKLALGVGWMLGFSGGIFAIIAAFWIGAAWSILVLILEKLKISHKRLTMKSEIPFAPFIILGVFIQIFTGWNLTNLIGF
jgi:leader peptidase (prepilin peptidase)/N-methyltransferase